jgi:hypothetical protein
VGKLYTVGTAGELYIAGEVCGSGQAVRQVGKLWVFGRGLASDPVLAQVSQWPTAPMGRRSRRSAATNT